MEGPPCIWGRAGEKIGSAHWTHLSYLGHLSLSPTPPWLFVHGETVNLNACIMRLNPGVKVSWRFSLHAGDEGGIHFSLFVYFNLWRENKKACVLNNSRGSSNNLPNRKEAFSIRSWCCCPKVRLRTGCHLMYRVRSDQGWSSIALVTAGGVVEQRSRGRNGTTVTRQTRTWILTLPLASWGVWLPLLHNKHPQT